MPIYNLETGEVTPIPDGSKGFFLMYNEETGKFEEQKADLDGDDLIAPEKFLEMIMEAREKEKNPKSLTPAQIAKKTEKNRKKKEAKKAKKLLEKAEELELLKNLKISDSKDSDDVKESEGVVKN